MSILIKGMEMPTKCEECEWSTTDRSGFFGCRLTGNIVIRKREKDRPDWCPLVPVPAHGRLIDADRLRHSHCAECTLYPDNCLGDECDWDSIFHIDHAPTIIPADGNLYDSLKRGLEQAINGESRSEIIPADKEEE